MLPGMKVFFEFSKTFYPVQFHWNYYSSDDDGFGWNENLFWDYAKVALQGNSTKHILAGYLVGQDYEPFANMPESLIVGSILRRLDKAFHGQATRSYLRHKIFDWTKEPFIRGAHSNRHFTAHDGAQNVQDRLFIAGEAFPTSEDTYGWVHGAAFSGRDAAEKIMALAQESCPFDLGDESLNKNG